MPLRARACVPRPVMSSPRNRTRPAVGGCMPVMTLKSVVLPAPFGPIRPVIVPGSTEKLAPLTAVTPPKRTVTSSTSSSGRPFVAVSGCATDGHLLPHADGDWIARRAAFGRRARRAAGRTQAQRPPAKGEHVADQAVRVATQQDRGSPD